MSKIQTMLNKHAIDALEAIKTELTQFNHPTEELMLKDTLEGKEAGLEYCLENNKSGFISVLVLLIADLLGFKPDLIFLSPYCKATAPDAAYYMQKELLHKYEAAKLIEQVIAKLRAKVQ